MYLRFKEAVKNWLARFISKYIMSDQEAHKRAALLNTSAENVYLRIELDRTKRKLEKTEASLKRFCEAGDNIVKAAMDADISETTPFMHRTILELENSRRLMK